MNDIDELIAILETEADAFANYGKAYDPDDYRLRAVTALQEMQEECKGLSALVSYQDKTLKRLDAILAQIKVLAESDQPWSQVIPAIIAKTDKARAGVLDD